ncbi:hypothetical protein HZS_831, partial [Henneguya salminicola]
RYQIVCANGSKESGDEIASTTLNNKSINYNFTKDFKIINLSAPIILGMDFMINNDVAIDIKSRAIFVNRNRISLLSHSKPNQIIVEKAKLCQVQDIFLYIFPLIPEKIQTSIVEYKNSNPEVGHISSAVHTIKLVDPSTIIRSKPYPIP